MERDPPPGGAPAPKRPRKPPNTTSSLAEAPRPSPPGPDPRVVRLVLAIDRQRYTSITGR